MGEAVTQLGATSCKITTVTAWFLKWVTCLNDVASVTEEWEAWPMFCLTAGVSDFTCKVRLHVFIPTKQEPHLIPPADQLILTFIWQSYGSCWLNWKPVDTPVLCSQDWTPLPYRLLGVRVVSSLSETKGTKHLCLLTGWYPQWCIFYPGTQSVLLHASVEEPPPNPTHEEH